jgi:Fe-Mn family superoxide dismutase
VAPFHIPFTIMAVAPQGSPAQRAARGGFVMKRTQLEARNFPHLTHGHMLPRTTLAELEALYRGHLRTANQIFGRLVLADPLDAHPVYGEWRSLKVALTGELAAVKGYEIFLSHLGPTGGRPSGALADQIRRDFGTFEGFVVDLRATALSSRGWVALCHDGDLNKLLTLVGDAPEAIAAWNLHPVMVMDVSERVAAIDFGRERRRYFDALLDATDWKTVARNLEEAMSRTTAGTMG